ncbi:50S ribosomal protein L2 [Patescibacteria group bacterium]|nr:50S ribosomal protein L2 [Patescibacteria group bacterium]
MIKKLNPRTPSMRSMTVTDYRVISDVKRHKNLTERLKKNSGRNNQGKISVRHQGGGNKIIYRMIDFKQAKMGIPGKVETIEYDPYRSAFIALVLYADGERKYILAPHGIKTGAVIVAGPEAPIEIGNRTILKRIPVGSFVHNVEIQPGKGGQLIRSAGSSAQVLAHEDGYTHLKMPSGEIRKISWDSYASIGQISNPEYNLVSIGKAGRSRWLNIRPTVRGSVMNPRDHPYGGGEGRQPRGTRKPKTKWGKVTGGHKTRRKNRYSNKLIVKRRK